MSADNFKKTLQLGGSIPEPAMWSGDTGQQIHCYGSCKLIKTWMYSIRLQAPKPWIIERLDRELMLRGLIFYRRLVGSCSKMALNGSIIGVGE